MMIKPLPSGAGMCGRHASAQTPGFPGVEDFAPVTPHVGSASDQPARATSGRRCATSRSIRAESVA